MNARVDVPNLIAELQRAGMADFEIAAELQVVRSTVFSWKMGDKRPSLDKGLGLMALHHTKCCPRKTNTRVTLAASGSRTPPPISKEMTMARNPKALKRMPGDAIPTPAVDESTTNVPSAVGLPTQAEAKADLAANPERHSVLSKDGHVVRRDPVVLVERTVIR